MGEALPGIKLAEEILMLAFNTEDSDVDEALKNLGIADSTYGVMWGAGDIRRSGMDLDLYTLKQEVLQFVRKIRADKRFSLVLAISVGRMRETLP